MTTQRTLWPPLEESKLARAFKDNEFDIAGLAKLPENTDTMLKSSLLTLHDILNNGRVPDSDNRDTCARILHGMIAVAQEEFATGGSHEYWPHLFDRIRSAVAAHPNRSCNVPFKPDLLGHSFRHALDCFGYSSPKEGQTNLTPILFHAGIPNSAIPGVVRFLVMVCAREGEQAIHLPIDLRTTFVESSSLQRNVKLLLASELVGARELWASLTRVVWAWQSGQDYKTELGQLSSSVDAQLVRDELAHSEPTTGGDRKRLPQLRYDLDTGEVYLWVPAGVRMNWEITDNRGPTDVTWFGSTAEFKSPLPEIISVKPNDEADGSARTFATQAAHWPGFWFRVQNGNLADGNTLDANGLDVGPWYVVLKGKPDRWLIRASLKEDGGSSDSLFNRSEVDTGLDRQKVDLPESSVQVERIQLKWSFFGHSEWTAWQIDVPPCGGHPQDLVCETGSGIFCVPLARRPGPKIEHVPPVANAVNLAGETVEVFAEPPVVCLKRDRILPVVLLKQSTEGASIIRRWELLPEQGERIPADEPGLYRLREARGIGRTLLDFAIVPGLEVSRLNSDPGLTLASLDIKTSVSVGEPVAGRVSRVESTGQHWHIEAETIEPALTLDWKWQDVTIPGLRFCWPLQGLRWRVTGLSDELRQWSRQSLFVDPESVPGPDAQFELHVPWDSEVHVNGDRKTEILQKGPSGDTLALKLQPYRDLLEVQCNGERHVAVVLSERPLVDSLEAGPIDERSVRLQWKPPSAAGSMDVIAWDPLRPSEHPKKIRLNAQERESGVWQGDLTSLPGADWTTVTLARSVGFFGEHRLAAQRQSRLQPIALFLRRSTCEARIVDTPKIWPELQHRLSLDLIDGLRRLPSEIAKDFDCLDDRDSINPAEVLSYHRSLDEAISRRPTARENDHLWRESNVIGLAGLIERQLQQHPAAILVTAGVTANECRLRDLLELGIAAGRTAPRGWLGEDCEQIAGLSYPIQYIRDLWILGTSPVDFARVDEQFHLASSDDWPTRQLAAADRVVEFHRRFGLPWPGRFLPATRSIAEIDVDKSECGHWHCFAIPAEGFTAETIETLKNALGLAEMAIDCEGTDRDKHHWQQQDVWPHFPILRAPPCRQCQHRGRRCEYSLFWDHRGSGWTWVVDRLCKSNPRTTKCCETNHQPLFAPPWSAQELAASIGLHELLASWGHDERQDWTVSDGDCLETLRQPLLADPVTGSIHAEVFWSPRLNVSEFRGRVTPDDPRTPLPACSIAAWQLSWIDRLSAWGESSRFFSDPRGRAGLHGRFLDMLATALSEWPQLMRRCLALSELLYWTLYRGGLGSAFRFRARSEVPQKMAHSSLKVAAPLSPDWLVWRSWRHNESD